MNTIFLLLAEFGQADVPVETVCSRYLGLDERQASLCIAPMLDGGEVWKNELACQQVSRRRKTALALRRH